MISATVEGSLDPSTHLDPNTGILRNLVGAQTWTELRQREDVHAEPRARWSCSPGVADLDLDHLQALYRHLCQDVYPWAGKSGRWTWAGALGRSSCPMPRCPRSGACAGRPEGREATPGVVAWGSSADAPGALQHRQHRTRSVRGTAALSATSSPTRPGERASRSTGRRCRRRSTIALHRRRVPGTIRS